MFSVRFKLSNAVILTQITPNETDRFYKRQTSVADLEPGSGIDAFLTPGSGIRDGKKIRTLDPDPQLTSQIIYPSA
jgi:hypothetical protein